MIIDAHTHVFPPRFREERERLLRRDATFRALYTHPGAKMATAEELVQSMDEAGVQASLALGLGWTDRALAQEANEYILEAAHRFPGRLVAFCGLNPLWGDDAPRELERLARAGVKGIGELHPDTQGFDLGVRALMAPLVETAERLGLLLLTHASEPVGHDYAGKGKTTPELLMRFIHAFPRARIICAHWGGGLPFYALMPEVADALQNVYFDCAASPFLYKPRVFEVVAGLVEPDHILFGTDFPLLGQGRLLDQVLQSVLSAEAQALVLGGNAARLLGL